LKKGAAFLKKSGAKNFCYAGSWAWSSTAPMAQIQKVFLLLFLQKKKAFSFILSF